jgi:hypothetical protein
MQAIVMRHTPRIDHHNAFVAQVNFQLHDNPVINKLIPALQPGNCG